MRAETPGALDKIFAISVALLCILRMAVNVLRGGKGLGSIRTGDSIWVKTLRQRCNIWNDSNNRSIMLAAAIDIFQSNCRVYGPLSHSTSMTIQFLLAGVEKSATCDVKIHL